MSSKLIVNSIENTTGTNVLDMDGSNISIDGKFDLQNDAASVLTVDRTTSDGTIIDVQKDGSTVGSIGVQYSNDLFVGSTYSSQVGLRFAGSSKLILPAHGDGTVTSADGTIDIGSGSLRFKDLYLSGGVYLGGTGSANKLDDYETGTFTPLFRTNASASDLGSSYTLRSGIYVKVGSLVYFGFDMDATIASTGGNVAYLGGLPFTPAATSSASVPTFRNCTSVTVGSGRILTPFIVPSVNAIHLQADILTSGSTTNISAFNSSGRANMHGVYLTDA